MKIGTGFLTKSTTRILKIDLFIKPALNIKENRNKVSHKIPQTIKWDSQNMIFFLNQHTSIEHKENWNWVSHKIPKLYWN